MLTSLFASTPRDAHYAQSVAAVTGFAGWVEATTLPPNLGYAGYQNSVNVFTQIKNGTMPWYNKVYPACMQISQQIEQADTAITSNLSTLTSLAQQLQSQPSNTNLHQQIVLAAQSLNGTVTHLAGSIETVSGNLQTSAGTITKDRGALIQQAQQMSGDWHTLSGQLGGLKGQLQALQNATTPDHGAIGNCQRDITAHENGMSTIQNLGQPYDRCIGLAADAAQALSFMAGYWKHVHAGAQCVIDALGKVAAAPVDVLKLDLAAAQQRWTQTLGLAKATNSQVAAMKLPELGIVRSGAA